MLQQSIPCWAFPYTSTYINQLNDDIYLSNKNLPSGIFDEDVHLNTLVIWWIGTRGLYAADPRILKYSARICIIISELP